MSWFNCKVSYEKLGVDSSKMRKRSEAYLVNAEDLTEVETLLSKSSEGRGLMSLSVPGRFAFTNYFLTIRANAITSAKSA